MFFSVRGAVSCNGSDMEGKCEEVASRICDNHGYTGVHAYRVYSQGGSPDHLSALSCSVDRARKRISFQ